MKDYKKILEGVVNIINNTEKSDIGFANICTYIGENCPELKESEDEKIKKALTHLVASNKELHFGIDNYDGIKWTALQEWIEKQGEQKPTNKVEPKFKIGDWVVTSYGKVNQVIAVDKDGDGFTLDDNTYFSGSWKDNYHLWTIQDAKDGDVLQLGKVTAIFKEFADNKNCRCYCSVYNGEFEIPSHDNSYGCHNAIPATKEQRDLLFQKMKEAGYEWSDKDRKLIKIVK